MLDEQQERVAARLAAELRSCAYGAVATPEGVTLPSHYGGTITARPLRRDRSYWAVELTGEDGRCVYRSVTQYPGSVIGRYFHHAEAH